MIIFPIAASLPSQEGSSNLDGKNSCHHYDKMSRSDFEFYEAWSVYVLDQRPEKHVYSTMPKLTLPRASSSSVSRRPTPR